MIKKSFVHICEEFEYTWIAKDNGMIPIYVHHSLGYDSKIVTCNLKKDLPENIRGVKIEKISRWIKKIGNFAPFVIFIKRIPLYFWIIKNAKNIDILMLFHITKCSYWNAYFYKKFNPYGKIYIKADFNYEVYKKELQRTVMKPKNLKEFFRKRREIKEYSKRKKLLQLVDKVSYETKLNYKRMKDSYAGISTIGKTLYFPNGYDDLYIEEKFKIKTREEKENIFLTVGRLGTYEKNTELILKTLEKLELKDWKFYLVGPIEKIFEKKIDEFFKKYPEKKESIKFLGEIKNKDELYDYYNRSKVFVLTSRYESFGIVLTEALAFNCYILSTDVGAVQDIVVNGENGEIITENNILDKLKEIINGDKLSRNSNFSSEKFKYSKIIEKLKDI